MTRTLVCFLLAPAFVLVPAAAGTSSVVAPKPLALTVAPARLGLLGSEGAIVRVRNVGTKRVAVDVAPAGFAIDLRGRPHIARRGARSAAGWLTVRPAHFTLGPHTTAQLRVSARLPRHVEPGDHDALALLTARPLAGAEVAVRLRLGVVVVVRAPGAVVRRLELRRLRVVRRGARRTLQLLVLNAGNVTEPLRRVRTVVLRLPAGRRIETLAASTRELRPQTRGVLDFRLRTRARGAVTARVVVPAEPGRAVIRRTFSLRL